MGRGSEGGPCMCLCTVYGSHRVHLFKNQKHFFFLFIIKIFTKTRNYKKKRRRKKLRTQKLRRTSSLVPSLKKKKLKKTLKNLWGFALFQSRLGRASFNKKKKTITFCLCCLFVRLFLKTCINELHTGL